VQRWRRYRAQVDVGCTFGLSVDSLLEGLEKEYGLA
jgi:hypothetical protein